MTRLTAILLSALIAAAPLSAAAQDRGRDRDRDRDSGQSSRQQPRTISVSEAQGIARSQAGGASYVGYVGMRGGNHVFRFDRNGQIFDIAVPATAR